MTFAPCDLNTRYGPERTKEGVGVWCNFRLFEKALSAEMIYLVSFQSFWRQTNVEREKCIKLATKKSERHEIEITLFLCYILQWLQKRSCNTHLGIYKTSQVDTNFQPIMLFLPPLMKMVDNYFTILSFKPQEMWKSL